MGIGEMNTVVKKYLNVNTMCICIAIALCFQRLSMAVGSIFWGLSIALFLFLLYNSYRAGTLREIASNYKSYYKILAFMLLCFVPSVLFSVDVETSVKAFLEMWVYRLIPFFMVTFFIREKEWLKKIFVAFVIATCIDCLVATYQVYYMNVERGWGFGGNSLNLASLLSVITPILAVVVFDDIFLVKLKKLCILALMCCFLGIIAGKSRGTWLTLCIVLPMISIYYMVKSKKVLVSCLVLAIAIGLIFTHNDYLHQRLVSIGNTTTDVSNADRIRVWKSTFNIISDYPITGVGLGNFREVYIKGNYRLKDTVQDLIHSHNNYLQLWSEGGTIGFVGFMTMSLYILITNIKLWLKTKSPFTLMIWGSWLSFMFFGMFDLIIDHSAITKVWWFLLGMLLVLENDRKKNSKEECSKF